jgi:hypothetical protein
MDFINSIYNYIRKVLGMLTTEELEAKAQRLDDKVKEFNKRNALKLRIKNAEESLKRK